jgi:PEGA domain
MSSLTDARSCGRRLVGAPAAALLLGVATAGCATVITGSRQEVPINVQPLGTIVCIDGVQAGTTPMIADLERRRSHMIILEKEGYEPAVVAVPTTVNPWIVGNFVPFFLIPGPIGLLVDIATGSVHQLDPGPTQFMLQPVDTAGSPPRPREVCTPL